MAEADKKQKTCAYCGEPAEGNYSIHRDGFGEGPEVDLCDAHGSHLTPTCEEIWSRIARPASTGFHAHLDACKRCRERPFDLCDVGARALEGEVSRG